MAEDPVLAGAPMPINPSPPFDTWLWLKATQETWLASIDPRGAGQWLRAQRLDRLLAFALRESPLYVRRARAARRLADLEPIGKAELMRHFDDWVTDRRITRAGAEARLVSTAGMADAWLDHYLLWTSSGTSGEPGLFVQDAASLAAYDAIDAIRLRSGAAMQPGLGVWGMRRCFAYVGAIGGAYAGHVSMERLRRLVPPAWAPTVHLLSVLLPLEHIAEQLQRPQPDVLITYPSCAVALARWKADGALHLPLDELWLGGEQLSAAQRALLQQSFHCPVRNCYGASEFYSMAFECDQGRLHLNDDWVILEGIDAHGRAVPAGEFSATTLLTHLANHVQPLLRYELTDRIRFDPEPCPCGSAFPVIEVQGRADDVLALPAIRGGAVLLLPLVLETVIEESTGITQFQLLHRPDGALELRLPGGREVRDTAFAACSRALRAFFLAHGVKRPRLVLGRQAPQLQRGSGKLRRVIDLSGAGPGGRPVTGHGAGASGGT